MKIEGCGIQTWSMYGCQLTLKDAKRTTALTKTMSIHAIQLDKEGEQKRLGRESKDI